MGIQKKHIVIIEDDLKLLNLLEKLLQAEGYKVSCFEALSTIEELMHIKADCFIIDEHLPNITGHIICILLKSKPQTMEVPVVLMSAYEELAYFADLCSADAYIKKPFGREEFLEVMDGAMHSVVLK